MAQPTGSNTWNTQAFRNFDPSLLAPGADVRGLHTMGSMKVSPQQGDLLLSPAHFRHRVGPNGDASHLAQANGHMQNTGLMSANVPSSNFMNVINFEALSGRTGKSQLNGNHGSMEDNMEGGVTDDGDMYLQQYVGKMWNLSRKKILSFILSKICYYI